MDAYETCAQSVVVSILPEPQQRNTPKTDAYKAPAQNVVVGIHDKSEQRNTPKMDAIEASQKCIYKAFGSQLI